jgi:hypothetical protein
MANVNPKEVEKYLKGMDYPAKKQDLVKHAQQQGAEQQVIEVLNDLPEGKSFEGPTGVNQAIGEIERQSGRGRQ